MCMCVCVCVCVTGLRARGVNKAMDFAIENNKWPCWFTDNGQHYDMVTPFIITAWVMTDPDPNP